MKKLKAYDYMDYYERYDESPEDFDDNYDDFDIAAFFSVQKGKSRTGNKYQIYVYCEDREIRPRGYGDTSWLEDSLEEEVRDYVEKRANSIFNGPEDLLEVWIVASNHCTVRYGDYYPATYDSPEEWDDPEDHWDEGNIKVVFKVTESMSDSEIDAKYREVSDSLKQYI